MRTIKFRIWNPIEKKMVESGGTPSMLSGFFHQTATLDTVHKMPYQQFTGLSDRNGKEIYEGDIVSYLDLPRSVEYENAHFVLNHTDRRQLDLDHNALDYIEIIGNIYENKELLV